MKLMYSMQHAVSTPPLKMVSNGHRRVKKKKKVEGGDVPVTLLFYFCFVSILLLVLSFILQLSVVSATYVKVSLLKRKKQNFYCPGDQIKYICLKLSSYVLSGCQASTKHVGE